ncbi:protein CASC4 isoform X2 [Rhinatrema bivittatum]|uniref:protein CASC4 isoform X2 n=1 Tax=Rhinatrema bivittatum TaxID=194408 RepID=UPI0011294D63|nr:protein CASC4 isoform X2 [Rhinatrema bivittatum]
MVGFGANRRVGRLPPFVLVALLVVIALLAFNYWSVSCRVAALQEELLGLQAQVGRTEVARSRLEKRNSDLMVQLDTHRKQIDLKQEDYNSLSGQSQRCEADRIKLQNNVSQQIAGIQRLKEQLAELRQEFLRQEDQLHEQKNNSTLLLQRLKSESLQCTQQMKKLEMQYEEKLKKIAVQVVPLSRQDAQKLEFGKENGIDDDDDDQLPKTVQQIGEKSEVKMEDLSRNHSQHVEAVRPGDDAGMPEIEEKNPAEADSLHRALKKPVLSNPPEEENLPVAASIPSIRHSSAHAEPERNINTLVSPDGAKENPEDPNLENSLHMQSRVQFGSNLQQQVPKEKDGDVPKLKQSRFFDENESPVDPHHGSKLADYNGDDGNVGEYEADKQAELAYNEEEDGDGGEEDVQDDEERELQGDAVDYRKDRFNDVL